MVGSHCLQQTRIPMNARCMQYANVWSCPSFQYERSLLYATSSIIMSHTVISLGFSTSREERSGIYLLVSSCTTHTRASTHLFLIGGF